jgi:preprotein translocase subunit SecG
MYILVTVLIIIASILLALAVLVQNSKGGGLASGFSASNQVMGVRKTTDFLEKFTWGLATTLIVLCILGAFALPKKSSTEGASVIQEQIDNATVPNQQAPQVPGGAQQQQQRPAQQQPAPAPAK